MVVLAPRMHDAVVFDMDGVITDTASVHAAAWKATFDEFLAGWAAKHRTVQQPFAQRDYLDYVDGKQRDDGVASFLESRGVYLPRGASSDGPERESVWGVANRKDAAFHRALDESGVMPFPTSVELVRRLRAQGIGTAIVSASRNCQQVLDAAGIGDLFLVRVDGVEVARLGLPGKPAPAIFLEAAHRLGVPAERTVVVEDAIAGVQAGRAGGFALVIGVDRGGQADRLRANGADAVVTDLDDVVVEGDDSASRDDWLVTITGFDENKLRVNASLFALADGRVGTSGAPLVSRSGAHRWVLFGNEYTGSGPETRLLTAPMAMHLPFEMADEPFLRRVLDLRTGVLQEEADARQGRVSSTRFSSLARPGLVAFIARCPVDPPPSELLLPPSDDSPLDAGRDTGTAWMRVAADGGGIVAAATERRGATKRDLVRIAVYTAGDDASVPSRHDAVDAVEAAAACGFDALIAEHRDAWITRWTDADITVEGDAELQRTIRYALFHLMASVADTGDAAVGARGLTGRGYRGHVFWDADTFTLPFLAATHPASARAMLEYRIRRLPAARQAARELGRRGARFPWESARSGTDVTPPSTLDRTGAVVPIRTGQLEEHIVADVAWAACCYADWTDDQAFSRGAGLELLIETARYWESRVRMAADGAHIDGVIGPDEYHEPVDDNAFTNVMARWNLRRAADEVERYGGAALDEVFRWREVADALVDGYDADTGIYEQFAGFNDLEPLIIAEVASRRPIAADLWLGAARVQDAQVVKQADVLMLHHLVPDAVEPDSLEPNLRFYEPRTAHGSSLSPGVHASLFARVRDYEHALEALRLASRLDLDDLTETTAGGLHIATMGSVWQALAFGFAGLRPRDGRLVVDPRLPHEWAALELRVRFHGSRVRVHIGHGALVVSAERPVPITVDSTSLEASSAGIEFRPTGRTWEVVT
jgi:beta-phosphoglucomutase family hydrolase